MSYYWKNLKVVFYALLGSGVVGIGVSFLFNLDKLIVLPFFPDVLDATCIIAAGTLLLGEMLREAARSRSKIPVPELRN